MSKHKNTKHTLLITIVIVLLVSNLLTLYFLRQTLKKSSTGLCNDKYNFISPRYRCGQRDIVDKKEYAAFKSKLTTYVDQQKNDGKVETVGVWFRDLESGPTFGINDRTDFVPASLLKLPLAMTFYDLAADDPNLLQLMINSSTRISDVPTQIFKPDDPIKDNTPYTIGALLTHALTHSDNIAAQLLYEYLRENYKDSDPLSQTYRDLGILEPGTDLDKAVVNTKEYGSIFRLLYNTSFLDKDASEKLLNLLTQSEFHDGLRQGVPGSIPIAHKFGERFLENGDKQLHDCGIIYYPRNPYELCVMTRGKNYDDLKVIIAEISREVYQEFDSRSLK